MENLRTDNLVPTANPGGGKGGVNFGSDPCSKFMLSLAAPRPGEAAKLVRQLAALPFRGSSPRKHEPPGYDLGSALVGYLEKLAVPFSRGEFLDPASLVIVKSWQLSICLDPLSAQITINDDEGDITYYFVEENKPREPLSHVVMFSGDLWLTFSTLLADTYVNENAIRMFQFLDATKPAKPGQEQENAGTLPGAPASLNNQPMPMGPAASLPRKVSAKTKIFKDAPLAGLVTAE